MLQNIKWNGIQLLIEGSPSDIGDLRLCWLSCLSPLIVLLSKTLTKMASQSFEFQHLMIIVSRQMSKFSAIL
jgi:hypothetical protein